MYTCSIARSSLLKSSALWLVFFAIAFGLGYPTLNRYDPRIQGPDQSGFYKMVVNASMDREHAVGHRVMIPFLAVPIHRLASGHVGSWNPVWFAMLVVNAAFVAAFAVAFLSLLARLGVRREIALLATFLYLVNFAVMNYQLAAYVDAGEAFFLMLATLALIEKRWLLLPLIAVGGTIAKETYFPIATAYVAGWLFALGEWKRPRVKPVAALLLTALAGFAVTTLLLSAQLGETTWPWNFAAKLQGSEETTSFFAGLWRLFANRDLWYVFIWLLPLSLPNLKRMPRPWLGAVVAACAVVLLLGAYDDSGANTNRPLFSIAGPLLALAAARTLQSLLPPGDERAG